MRLETPTAAPMEVQVHLFFAVLALLIGPVALFRKRRDRVHKTSGYVASLAIIGLSISGFFIASNMPVIFHFGPIHLLCIYALWSVVTGIRAAIQGNFARHQRTMRALFLGGVGVAGLLTLLPGRMLNDVLFSQSLMAVPVIVVGALGLWWALRSTRQARPN